MLVGVNIKSGFGIGVTRETYVEFHWLNNSILGTEQTLADRVTIIEACAVTGSLLEE